MRSYSEIANDAKIIPLQRPSFENLFQPSGSRFTAGYRCGFHSSKPVFVQLLLVETRDFAEHTHWKNTQRIPIEYVGDVKRGNYGFGVFKYLND